MPPADAASPGGPGPDARVLVAGVDSDELTAKQHAVVARYRLLDRGDHVEWTDGKQTKQWRLADQDGDRSLPVLASVRRLRSRSELAPGRVSLIRPIYCDPEGRFLGYASAPRMWVAQLSEQCYPPAAFGALEARGVDLADEELLTVEQVERAHPGIGSNSVLSFYRRHAFLVILAIFVVVIVVVELATFL